PDLPVKHRLRDEERHVFASLCDAAPRVVLSWQHADDEGRTRVESPFVVRLRVARPDLPMVAASPVLAPEGGEDPVLAAAPRPADERLALAGLRARGARALEGVRAVALEEVRQRLCGDPALGDGALAALDPRALARHQEAALRELDAPPRTPAPPPGPWLGWIGAPRPASEGPAEAALYVTRLEAQARCPWQAFLRKELGLEPVPDALEALPAPHALLLGKTAHAVLERIVVEADPQRPRTLREALERGPVRAPWPDADRLARWTLEAAERAAAEEGIALPGFARALAQRVAPLLAAARAADWSDPGGHAVLGAELDAEVEIADAAGRPRRIAMRVDRADLGEGGALRLTDYKTGPARSASGGRLPARTRADTLHRHLLQRVREGSLLQAVAYRLAAGALAPGRAAEGRYLHLPEAPLVLAVGDDARGAELVDAFLATARTLLDAADRGLAPPRLDTQEGQVPCKYCEVRAACLQGESGPRRRLEAWALAAAEAERAGEAEGAAPAARLGPDERALLRLFRLREEAKEAVRSAGRDEGEEAGA
ncbi:MAG TPA: PD-(D/E)XK nuclease family protein, partial [Myxococcota bacterium]